MVVMPLEIWSEKQVLQLEHNIINAGIDSPLGILNIGVELLTSQAVVEMLRQTSLLKMELQLVQLFRNIRSSGGQGYVIGDVLGVSTIGNNSLEEIWAVIGFYCKY